MRLKRKNKLLPLVVLLGSIGIIAGGVFAFSLFFSADDGVARTANLSSSDETRAEVKLSGEQSWNEVIDIALYEGDTVRSKSSNSIKITFHDNTVVYLDKNTNVLIKKARGYEDNSTLVEIDVEQGRIWVSVERKLNPLSKVVVNSPLTNLQAETSHAEFSFSQGQVAVIEGNKVFVSIPSNSKDVASFSRSLGAGQMLSLTNEDLEKIKKGFEGPLEEMISEKFISSDWYKMHKENKLVITEEDESDADTEAETDDNETTTEEDEDNTPAIAGELKITSPNNGIDYTSKTTEITLEGTASSDVAKVIVDDWELQKFEQGNTTWSYKISQQFDNHGKPGEKITYLAEAFDKNGKLVATDSIAITFDYDEEDLENLEEETTEENEELEEGTVENANFKITDPSTEDTYKTSDAEIIVKGIAPTNTAKITVSDYKLQAYQAGAGEWSYKIKEDFGNRPEAGSSLTYTARAYDADDKLIGSDSITIEIEEGTTNSTEETPTTSVSGEISR